MVTQWNVCHMIEDKGRNCETLELTCAYALDFIFESDSQKVFLIVRKRSQNFVTER
jgi:hypothetical protein